MVGTMRLCAFLCKGLRFILWLFFLEQCVARLALLHSLLGAGHVASPDPFMAPLSAGIGGTPAAHGLEFERGRGEDTGTAGRFGSQALEGPEGSWLGLCFCS